MMLAEKSAEARFGAALALAYLAFSAVFWAYPFVWLLSLPFRIIGITLHGVFGLLSAILLLPARLLRGPRAI